MKRTRSCTISTVHGPRWAGELSYTLFGALLEGSVVTILNSPWRNMVYSLCAPWCVGGVNPARTTNLTEQ